MKRFFLSLFPIFLLIFFAPLWANAQDLPKELKGKWEGKIIVVNNGVEHTGLMKLGFGAGFAKDEREVDFTISKFSSFNYFHAKFIESAARYGYDDKGREIVSFSYIMPYDNTAATVSGSYSLVRYETKGGYDYLIGTFKSTDRSVNGLKVDIVLFKKDAYKTLNQNKELDKTIAFILNERSAATVTTPKGNAVSKEVYQEGNNLITPKISPEVIYIDVDEISGINNNTLLVKKGDKYAYMNLKGDIISPYNAFDYGGYQTSTKHSRGFRYVTPTKRTVHNYGGRQYMDETGKIIFKEVNGMSPKFNYRIYYKEVDDKSIVAVDRYDQPIPFINSCRNRNMSSEFRANPPSEFIDFNYEFSADASDCLTKQCELDMIPAVQYKRRKNESYKDYGLTHSSGISLGSYSFKYGMVDRNGKTVIPFEFDAPFYFSDGMACVTKIDEFKKVTYGFINAKGELAIPYRYSRRPGDFHEGLALVAPRENIGFDYAYIDKTGEIKIKIGDGNGVNIKFEKTANYPTASTTFEVGPVTTDANFLSSGIIYLPENGFFYNGYAMWIIGGTLKFLDKSGKQFSFKELLSKGNTGNKEYAFSGRDEIGIYIYPQGNHQWQSNKKGMVDYSYNLLFPPIFSDLEIDHNGKCAIATMSLPYNPQKRDNYIKGIVNSSGEFIVLPKEKSKW